LLLFLLVWALTSFKEAIYEDPNLALSNWNMLESDLVSMQFKKSFKSSGSQ
jgi:hypothetical protein